MKINEVADVVDLQKRRKQKAAAAEKQAWADFDDDIEHVVDATIEELVDSGMNEQAAEKAVIGRLSDLIMAYDLE